MIHPALVVDNFGLGGTTNLVSLGSGTAASGTVGARLETASATAIPSYFVGHWIEIRTPGGALVGRWRVGVVNGTSLELIPNGTEPIEIQPGDAWQGAYVFSEVVTAGGASVTSSDPIRIDRSPRE